MFSRSQPPRGVAISDIGRMAKEGEAQKAARHHLTAEARKIFTEEKERQRQEEEQTDDSSNYHQNDYKVRTSNGSISSRFSSRESSMDPTSIASSSVFGKEAREFQKQMNRMEAKYKEVMLANSQLDGDKQLMSYNLYLLKDKLEDMTEDNLRNQKCAADRKKDLAYLRMQISDLTHQLETARHQIQMHNEMFAERGFVVVNAHDMSLSTNSPPIATGSQLNGVHQNGETDSSIQKLTNSRLNSSSTATDDASSLRRTSGLLLLSTEIAETLENISGTDIDSKLSTLLQDRQKSEEIIKRLKSNLEEERERAIVTQKLDMRSIYKGSDPENLRQSLQAARSQSLEYKFKLEQAVQKIAGLEGDIIRFEGQVKRYKTISDNCELQEDQLKADRRKLQRELREAKLQIDDLKSEKNTLQRRIDKLMRSSGNNVATSRNVQESLP